MEGLSDEELEHRFPEHPKVYRSLERYAPARPDFLWANERNRIEGMIDRPPMRWRSGQDMGNRCRFWKGTTRYNNQDVIYIRGGVYPVVKVIWELTYGPIELFRRGSCHSKRVARPVCCNYKLFGICVNSNHYEIRSPTGWNRRINTKGREDLLQIWKDGQTSVATLAQIFGLSERYVYQLVADAPQKGKV